MNEEMKARMRPFRSYVFLLILILVIALVFENIGTAGYTCEYTYPDGNRTYVGKVLYYFKQIPALQTEYSCDIIPDTILEVRIPDEIE